MKKFLFLALMLAGAQATAYTADQLADAKWMLERIEGIKVSSDNPILIQMANLIAQGNRAGAAALATAQPGFINITVKQFALQMSNRQETFRDGLNDFTATIMGVARDGTDARELLYGNFFYKGDPTKIDPTKIRSDMFNDILNSNNHYADLENKVLDVSSVLMRVNSQYAVASSDPSVASYVPHPDPGGVLTSRQFLMTHAEAGTNRRLVEFTFREFMCTPISGWADNQAADNRIGRDVDRFPGGDHNNYLNKCKACHSVMDGFRGAFAKYDTSGRLEQSGFAVHSGVAQFGSGAPNGQPVGKMNKNNTVYPGGFVTVDDSWVNNAIRPANAAMFGWRDPSGGLQVRGPASVSGTGVNAFGRLVANSQRFSQCMVERAFKSVCLKSIDGTDMSALMMKIAPQFEQSGYNLKKLFELTVVDSQCK